VTIPGDVMAESKRAFVGKAAKAAGDAAANVGNAVVGGWKDLNEATQRSIEKTYNNKRPLAIAKLKELKSTYPDATPLELQSILDAELNEVEATKGPLSIAYSRAASLYLLTSIELRQLDPASPDTRRMLFDLLVLLDTAIIRGVRRGINIAIWLVPQLKVAKGAKGAKVAKVANAAVKGAKVARSAVVAKKAIKIAKATALPVAKTAFSTATANRKTTSFIISQTLKVLGPVEENWKPAKPAKKAPKK